MQVNDKYVYIDFMFINYLKHKAFEVWYLDDCFNAQITNLKHKIFEFKYVKNLETNNKFSRYLPRGVDVLKLSKKNQERCANVFSEGSQELKTLLLWLWERGIGTHGSCSGIEDYEIHKRIEAERRELDKQDPEGKNMTAFRANKVCPYIQITIRDESKSRIADLISGFSEKDISKYEIQFKYMSNVKEILFGEGESSQFFSELLGSLIESENKSLPKQESPSAKIVSDAVRVLPDIDSDLIFFLNYKKDASKATVRDDKLRHHHMDDITDKEVNDLPRFVQNMSSAWAKKYNEKEIEEL